MNREAPKRCGLFEVEHKPKIPSELGSTTSSTHPPSGSSLLSPRKRDHAHLDDQANLTQIVQDCVAHVAEEARASQTATAPGPASTEIVIPEVDQAAISLKPKAPVVSVLASTQPGRSPADKIISTQTEPVTVEAPRAIASLPKRARGKGLLTFLSGMAVAVVGMECLGILAGMMEE